MASVDLVERLGQSGPLLSDTNIQRLNTNQATVFIVYLPMRAFPCIHTNCCLRGLHGCMANCMHFPIISVYRYPILCDIWKTFGLITVRMFDFPNF